MADPDLELKRGGAVLIYLPCRPFSLQSFLLFSPKIRGGGGGERDNPNRKLYRTGIQMHFKSAG